MSTPIKLPRPARDADLVRFFCDQLDALQPAMDLSVTEHDELAVVTALRVTSVASTETTVDVQYVVQWQAFHACSDQHVAGESSRMLRGRKDGEAWVFEPQAAPPVRGTVEEF